MSSVGNRVVDSPLIVDVVNNTTVDCPSSLMVSQLLNLTE